MDLSIAFKYIVFYINLEGFEKCMSSRIYVFS